MSAWDEGTSRVSAAETLVCSRYISWKLLVRNGVSGAKRSGNRGPAASIGGIDRRRAGQVRGGHAPGEGARGPLGEPRHDLGGGRRRQPSLVEHPFQGV